jgi:hypothetical protein
MMRADNRRTPRFESAASMESNCDRAGDRTRTGDVQLGKLAFYQLNYARDNETTYRAEQFAKRHLSK